MSDCVWHGVPRVPNRILSHSWQLSPIVKHSAATFFVVHFCCTLFLEAPRRQLLLLCLESLNFFCCCSLKGCGNLTVTLIQSSGQIQCLQIRQWLLLRCRWWRSHLGASLVHCKVKHRRRRTGVNRPLSNGSKCNQGDRLASSAEGYWLILSVGYQCVSALCWQ